ncbi:MAG: hypothetical protein AAGD92_00400 [Pseudomonadota bacterium]
MGGERLVAAIAAAIVATLGLWWFRLIMSNVRTMPKTPRYGIYALVWLTYFVVVMMFIGLSGNQG